MRWWGTSTITRPPIQPSIQRQRPWEGPFVQKLFQFHFNAMQSYLPGTQNSHSSSSWHDFYLQIKLFIHYHNTFESEFNFLVLHSSYFTPLGIGKEFKSTPTTSPKEYKWKGESFCSIIIEWNIKPNPPLRGPQTAQLFVLFRAWEDEQEHEKTEWKWFVLLAIFIAARIIVIALMRMIVAYLLPNVCRIQSELLLICRFPGQQFSRHNNNNNCRFCLKGNLGRGGKWLFVTK